MATYEDKFAPDPVTIVEGMRISLFFCYQQRFGGQAGIVWRRACLSLDKIRGVRILIYKCCLVHSEFEEPLQDPLKKR